MKIKSKKSPIYSRKNGYDEWIDISKNRDQTEFLSVSPNSRLEIIDLDNKQYILFFPVCRFVSISDSSNDQYNIITIEFNDKDIKDASEFPPKNLDEKLK